MGGHKVEHLLMNFVPVLNPGQTALAAELYEGQDFSAKSEQANLLRAVRFSGSVASKVRLRIVRNSSSKRSGDRSPSRAFPTATAQREIVLWIRRVGKEEYRLRRGTLDGMTILGEKAIARSGGSALWPVRDEASDLTSGTRAHGTEDQRKDPL